MYAGNQTINGSDNGLAPGRCQAIIGTNAGIKNLATNFSEILSEIHTFSFKKMHLKMSAILFRRQCVLGNFSSVLSVIIQWPGQKIPFDLVNIDRMHYFV